jgi:hypothetical protein
MENIIPEKINAGCRLYLPIIIFLVCLLGVGVIFGYYRMRQNPSQNKIFSGQEISKSSGNKKDSSFPDPLKSHETFPKKMGKPAEPLYGINKSSRSDSYVSEKSTPHHDIFISYSHEDKPIADAICAALESENLRCWIAPRDVLPGENYPAAIINAIEQSRIMVLVYSSRSNTSDHVIRELTKAVSTGVIILPFRIEDIPPSKDMEYLIGIPHWLDALTPPLEQHIEKLVQTVKILLTKTKIDG